MSVRTSTERPRRGRLRFALVTAALALVVLAVVGQMFRPRTAIGHDSWSLLPPQEWNIAVGKRAGFWDGMDPKTHQGIGGRMYVYGFIERWTNTR